MDSTAHWICSGDGARMNATQVGKELGGLSAQKVNFLLWHFEMLDFQLSTKGVIFLKPTRLAILSTVAYQKESSGRLVTVLTDRALGFLKNMCVDMTTAELDSIVAAGELERAKLRSDWVKLAARAKEAEQLLAA